MPDDARGAPSLAAALPRPGGTGWPAALAALAVLLAGWAALFASEIAAAVRVWNSSAAYNHCWLILPIAAWLAWQRRGRLVGLAPAPAPLLLAALLPLGLAWLLAERLGIMEGRQLTALGMAVVATVALLGWRFGRAMAAPLAYLVFLVPFGAFTVPMLQRVTARMIEFLLGLTDIPHYVDDIVIEIPVGTFLVAEACAGLRFLIAAIAFGALYALVMFRSPWRRLIVMVLSVVVPILANGLRGFGLVLIGHYSGNAAAVDADHVLYGWVFFSIVLLLLILAGLPFRQDGAPPAAIPGAATPAAPGRPAGFAATVLAAGLLAGAGPAGAALLDRGGAAAPRAVALALAAPPGCVATGGGAGLRCGEWQVTSWVRVFPAGANWSRVVAERRAFTHESDIDRTFAVVPPGGAVRWDVRQSGDGDGARAVATWLDGRPAGEGLRDRARQAWNAFRGGAATPVVVGVEVRREGGSPLHERAERDLLERVLAAQDAALVAPAAALSRPQ